MLSTYGDEMMLYKYIRRPILKNLVYNQENKWQKIGNMIMNTKYSLSNESIDIFRNILYFFTAFYKPSWSAGVKQHF